MTQNYVHPKRKTKVVFVQLGSPAEPTTKALRKYLRLFLGDPRVIDINPWLWKIILNFFDPPKVKKQDLKVAHNQPKSFFFTVQPSQQPTAQNRFFIT